MIDSLLKIIPPLLIAGCAGYFPFRGGILNIGLEGLMAVGAFFGYLVAAYTGFWAAGLAAGVIAGGAAGAFLSWTILKLRANVFLSGLAINLAAAGVLGIVSQKLFNTKGVLNFGNFSSLPEYTPVLLAAAFFIIMLVLFRKVSWGHRIIAAGEAPSTLLTLGESPARIQFQTLILSGAGTGLAGALLSLDIHAYVPNMTGGRGWIALVALYIAGPHPIGMLGTVVLFSAASAGSTILQGVQGIPDSLLLASPFLITFIGLGIAGTLRTVLKRKG